MPTNGFVVNIGHIGRIGCIVRGYPHYLPQLQHQRTSNSEQRILTNQPHLFGDHLCYSEWVFVAFVAFAIAVLWQHAMHSMWLHVCEWVCMFVCFWCAHLSYPSTAVGFGCHPIRPHQLHLPACLQSIA